MSEIRWTPRARRLGLLAQYVGVGVMLASGFLVGLLDPYAWVGR